MRGLDLQKRPDLRGDEVLREFPREMSAAPGFISPAWIAEMGKPSPILYCTNAVSLIREGSCPDAVSIRTVSVGGRLRDTHEMGRQLYDHEVGGLAWRKKKT